MLGPLYRRDFAFAIFPSLFSKSSLSSSPSRRVVALNDTAHPHLCPGRLGPEIVPTGGGGYGKSAMLYLTDPALLVGKAGKAGFGWATVFGDPNLKASIIGTAIHPDAPFRPFRIHPPVANIERVRIPETPAIDACLMCNLDRALSRGLGCTCRQGETGQY